MQCGKVFFVKHSISAVISIRVHFSIPFTNPNDAHLALGDCVRIIRQYPNIIQNIQFEWLTIERNY